MSDILRRILAAKREEVAAARIAKPLVALRAEAEATVPPRDFAGALRQRLDAGRAAVIAEIGAENQGLPALVLHAPVPADALRDLDVRESNGRRFLKSPTDIGRYLARTRGIGEPH